MRLTRYDMIEEGRKSAELQADPVRMKEFRRKVAEELNDGPSFCQNVDAVVEPESPVKEL